MFTVALCTIARTWKQPKCPSTEEWIENKWYIYTMEYHLAIKKGTKLCHLQQHGPRDCHTESSQTQEDKYCMILLICGI